jgi:diguanylate cyclase (GGDEF)-like protein
MLIGSLIPWLGLIVYLSGRIPHHLDTTPLALTLSAPLFAWGLFRYRIFDLAPVAKESVFSSMKDGAIVLDIFDRIVDYNPAAKQVLPVLSRRAIGRTLRDVAPDRKELNTLPPPEETATLDIELEGNGRNRFFRASLSPIHNRRRSLMGRVVFLIETTAQVELMDRLKELATIDDLTGTFLRRHFLELFRKEISRAKRYGRPVSVLILDLDHFKQINDTFGHEAGDAVLKASAGALRKALRSADLLCRHGGEEFAILLPETPLDQAVLVAERLRRTIRDNPIRFPDGTEVRITASIGAAGLKEFGGVNPEDLLRAADAAMYVAKAAGRNAIHAAAPNG